jgi:F-type H+-transporting ATPase subunit b
MPAKQLGLVLVLALGATPAFAQPAPAPAPAPAPTEDEAAKAPSAPSGEAGRASREASGDSATASGPGTEHHAEGGNAADEEEPDPSRHFNFLGIQPGHLFDYAGKDEYGGPFGDGKMVVPDTQQVIHEEEPASPPFLFMLLNFALLLGILAWKGRPVAQKVAEDRHDLIKTALDEAAKLRKQAADKLAEYETRLKDADAEIAKLVEGMRVDAENEKQRILAAAEAQAQLMKRDAELRIAAEIELARAQLTREVTAASAAATEKLLREKLTAGDQQTLVNAFITDVSKGGSGGRTSPTGQGDVR